MNIKTLAIYLLIGRILALAFMAFTLLGQTRLLLHNDPPDLQGTRRVFLLFGLVITIGNIIPFMIDIVTILSAAAIRSNPTPIGVLYACSSLFVGLMSSVFMAYLYRGALRGQVGLIRKND